MRVADQWPEVLRRDWSQLRAPFRSARHPVAPRLGRMAPPRPRPGVGWRASATDRPDDMRSRARPGELGVETGAQVLLQAGPLRSCEQRALRPHLAWPRFVGPGRSDRL